MIVFSMQKPRGSRKPISSASAVLRGAISSMPQAAQAQQGQSPSGQIAPELHRLLAGK